MDNTYNANENRQEFEDRMIAEGYKCIYPGEHELQIDIDTDDEYSQFLQQIEKLQNNMLENWGDISWNEKVSRGGLPGRHITVTMPEIFELTPYRRIMWQAILGSDPVRELLSAMRAMKFDSHPTLFVEKTDE